MCISLCFVLVVLASPSLVPCVSGSEDKRSSSNEKCEYEIDLTKNLVKAVCQGQAMGVSVYADTASVVTKSSSGQQTRRPVSSGGHINLGESPTLYGGEFLGQKPTDLQNISSLFRDIRRKLGSHSAAIVNISSLLDRGDADLKRDLENLHAMMANQASFSAGVVATLQNQYNFMRTAILAQNAEVGKVLELVDVLTRVTADSLQTSLRQHAQLAQQLQYVNRTMLVMRKMWATQVAKKTGKRRHKKKKDTDRCTQPVSAFGRGEELTVPWENGAVMRDAADSEGSDRLWIMTGAQRSDQLLQYESLIDIQYRLVSRQYALPFYCEGTGHVVYRSALYCQKAGTRVLAKYNLRRMEIKAEAQLPSAGISNTFPYQFGLNSDIDFAVDELGLWVVYSTAESAGKMVISKLSPRTLTVEKTWMTSYPKQLVGNSFMICGVLYATNSFEETPTFIRYMYDTNTQTESIQEPGQLVFQNTVSFNASSTARSVMLDYDARTQKLYSWSNSRIQGFPVFFKSMSP